MGELKGLVLSGGAGTRLRPITHTRAKQLVPVANTPVLFYGLRALAEAGITDVGIIVGDTRAEIEEAVGDGSQFGLRVEFISQEKPLGLAHAVLTARDFLADDPFVMYLGDNLLRDGIGDLVERFRGSAADAMILLQSVPDPGSYGVVELDGDRVVRLVEKPEKPPSDKALVGVYMFTAAVHESAQAIEPSDRGELEITDAIQHMIERGLRVEPHEVTGWWKDTGRVEDMLEANRLILDVLESRIEGEVADTEIVGPVVVEAGARVVGSRLTGPIVIGASAHIENAAIGPHTALAAGVTVINADLRDSIVLDRSRIEDVGMPIAGSLIGRDVVVRRGAGQGALRLTLGDSCTVGVA